MAERGGVHIFACGSACIVVGTSCRHTHNGGGQSRQQVPGPTAGALAASEVLAASVRSCGYKSIAMDVWQWRPVMQVR